MVFAIGGCRLLEDVRRRRVFLGPCVMGRVRAEVAPEEISGEEALCVLEEEHRSRLTMWFHAAHLAAGGDRSSSSTAERR